MRPDCFFFSFFLLFNSPVQHQNCTTSLHLKCSCVSGTGLVLSGIPVPCLHGFLIRFIHSFSILHSPALWLLGVLLEPIPAVTGGEGRVHPQTGRLFIARHSWLDAILIYSWHLHRGKLFSAKSHRPAFTCLHVVQVANMFPPNYDSGLYQLLNTAHAV